MSYGGGYATYFDPASSVSVTPGTAAALPAGAGGYTSTGSGSTGTSGSGGFFSNLTSGLTPAALTALGSGIAKVGGAVIGADANQTAADTSSAATVQAAQIAAAANLQATQEELDAQQAARDQYTAASQKGIGYIQGGLNSYESTVAPLLTPAPVTLPSYRGLTPAQQTGEANLLRTGNATLASSGLRGAGRAGVAGVIDQDKQYQEDAATSTNQSDLAARQTAQTVANTSRQNLANTQAQAGGSEANTALLTGNQLGSSLQAGGQAASSLTSQTGASTGAATAQAGQTQANADTADASLEGSALGSVASALSNPNVIGGGTPNTPGLVNNGTGYIAPTS
jgi:hypothetical protein